MAGGDTTSVRAAIARHFRSRIPALLDAWRAEVAAEPALTSDDALPRSQLEDHLPLWLDALADLLGSAPEQAAAAKASEEQVAEAHGLQRWQQGYDLREVMLEWACMHRVLVAELEHVAADPAYGAADLAEARLKLAEQIGTATTGSAAKYFGLERVEAIGNVRDLERALADLRSLENARAELWQQAAHDLRGNLGVVANVADGLEMRALPDDRRENFVQLLRRNVTSLRLLLDDVTGLARLHAGQEQCVIAPYDAADLLRRLCSDVTPMAEAKGLSLKAEGPLALPVEGDAIKVRRVVQNLALNALKYTHQGGLHVTWGDSEGDDERWLLVIQDTGPGFHAGPGAPLAAALGQATAQAGEGPAASAPAPPDSRTVRQVQGEGLGLAIVKRLCELMRATVEVESIAGTGTTFRIRLPRRYEKRAN